MWFDELIGLPLRIAAGEGLQGIRYRHARTPYQQIISACDPFPTLVPVHGEVAAHNARDTHRGILHVLQEPLRITLATPWIGIPSIGERVHEHILQALAMSHVA